jgi:hypothetical protein
MGVPTALDLILIAALAADGHELFRSARDDWWLLARTDPGFLGGFRPPGGPSPR